MPEIISKYVEPWSKPWKQVSVSQLKVWPGKGHKDGCLRKGVLRYGFYVYEPDSPEAAFGTQLHAAAEDWLKHGKMPAPGEVYNRLLPGLVHWPRPGTLIGLKTEHSLYIPIPEIQEGLSFLAKKDLEWHEPSEEHGPKGLWWVGDHKTTKNLFFALDSMTLAHDPQAGLYAQSVMRSKNVGHVGLRWVYYLTEGEPRATKAQVIVSFEKTRHHWVRMLEQAKQIKVHRERAQHWKNIPVCSDRSICDAYRGCWFKPLCFKGVEAMAETMQQVPGGNALYQQLVAGLPQTAAPLQAVQQAPQQQVMQQPVYQAPVQQVPQQQVMQQPVYQAPVAQQAQQPQPSYPVCCYCGVSDAQDKYGLDDSGTQKAAHRRCYDAINAAGFPPRPYDNSNPGVAVLGLLPVQLAPVPQQALQQQVMPQTVPSTAQQFVQQAAAQVVQAVAQQAIPPMQVTPPDAPASDGKAPAEGKKGTRKRTAKESEGRMYLVAAASQIIAARNPGADLNLPAVSALANDLEGLL